MPLGYQFDFFFLRCFVALFFGVLTGVFFFAGLAEDIAASCLSRSDCLIAMRLFIAESIADISSNDAAESESGVLSAGLVRSIVDVSSIGKTLDLKV